MTEDQVKEIAEEAADAAVRKTFLALGVDIGSAAGVLSTQKDLAHLRAWRESSDTIKRQAITTAVGIFVTGILGLIYLAFSRH